MGMDGFVGDYCRRAKEKGYHASRTKAESIFRVACNGIPTLPSGAAPTKMLTQEAIRILKEINKTLSVILSEMHTTASQLPEYETALDMPGVGETLSVRLIAEIGDVRRFHSGSALVAYAGIDSPPYESGNFVGTKRRISKRGSALLRKTGYELIQCIKSIKPQDDLVYLFMIKKENKGKAKRAAEIAALNKFLRIYYDNIKNLADSDSFYLAGL